MVGLILVEIVEAGLVVVELVACSGWLRFREGFLESVTGCAGSHLGREPQLEVFQFDLVIGQLVALAEEVVVEVGHYGEPQFVLDAPEMLSAPVRGVIATRY